MPDNQPNIIVLMPDQLRWDFLGCYGAAFAHTPAMDELASHGVRYERAISPHPLCIPARASLLTGHNALATGVLTNGCWLRPDHTECGMPSFAELLSGNGYQTAAIGKMHFIPWDIGEGFGYRRIAEDKRHVYIQDDYADYLAAHGLRKLRGVEEEGYQEHLMASVSPIPAEHQVDTWVGNEVVDFIKTQAADQPFLLMVGFPGPHDPYNPPADWIAKFAAETMPASISGTAESEAFRPGQIEHHRQGSANIDLTEFPEPTKRRIRAHYSALVSMIDHQIGRILDALEDQKLSDNTIIILTSDHGDLLGDFDLIGKNNFFEPAIHVPLVVRTPGDEHGRICNDLVTLTDLFATVLAYAGISSADPEDSYPLPLLGLSSAEPRRYAMGAIGSGTMIMDQRFKLTRYTNGVTALYDIDLDPGEQINRIDDPDLAELRAKLESQMTNDLLHNLRRANRDKTYAYATMTPDHPSHDRGWQRPYPVGQPLQQDISPTGSHG